MWPSAAFEGEVWRHCNPNYDPLSGEGARRHGGRFNPRGIPTLYLCTTTECAQAEYSKQGTHKSLPASYLYRISANLHPVLDLAREETRSTVGVMLDDLVSDDWSACQDIGKRAYEKRFQAVISWSSTGQDKIMVVFTERAENRLAVMEMLPSTYNG